MNGHDLSNGMMWQDLYLPSGTQLYTPYKGIKIFAEVRCGKINVPSLGKQFRSPGEACNAMRGDTSNNAWREFFVSAPGSDVWTGADTLRQDVDARKRFIQACEAAAPQREVRRVPAMASDAKTSDTTSKPAPEPRYIDMTPTWRGLMPLLIEVAANGDSAAGRKGALDELNRLADMADGFGPRMDAMSAALKAFLEATKNDPRYAALITQAGEALKR
ncbi:hypothetical protein SAMN04487926_13835 [Paraburkholderia steynii]|uniref:Uncharacterized protein n=1 Tax=Paraburkholderia steynii TaxID=1245441 RepID=A0A7Z7BH29_9BURK|nr:hypothetical protein [Paraburkholderia steynii]SDJ22763.1 hypothetical protein SAMN04487926_13835 [Paraburkholderia steynii]